MLVNKAGYVYIITNKLRRVLYTGVTSDLRDRIYQHKSRIYQDSFAARYNCDVLLCYELLPTITEAIVREKQIKAGSRAKKEQLIRRMNPGSRDLWEDIQNW